MSEQQLDSATVADAPDYPPFLNAIVPGCLLVLSLAYAWSLRDVTNADMNLLLLRPLFAIIWVLLAVVIAKDVMPSLALHRQWWAQVRGSKVKWGALLDPGTEANAGLVVVATFVLAFFGPGRGAIPYVASIFIYLTVTGYILNDRHIGKLLLQAALCTVGLYLVMGVALSVRL